MYDTAPHLRQIYRRAKRGKGLFMKDIKIGACAEKTLTVSGENTAVAAGSGSLPVLGTPFMIALMEGATCDAVAEYLEDGETTVGTLVNVSHDRASKTGEKITARAEITQADGRKITFAVEAHNESGVKIGGGTIERFAVSGEKFMAKLG